ncbi:MAG: cortexillin II [Clostridia bacterium]|nr:cortexillin II [Clostridia bacterium]MDR3644064.1 cortexillin II [Clostridia bacterium]
MARRAKTVESRISEIEAQKAQFQSKIDNYKAKIANLDAKALELIEAQKQKELENLLEVIKASGKTPEEVIAALNSDRPN